MSKLVEFSVNPASRVAILELNRPEKLNALNAEMISSAVDHLDKARHDHDIRAVVIAGRGRAFCSGQDTGDLADAASQSSRQMAMPPAAAPLPRSLFSFPKPTVAAIQGLAIGAGFDVALACDFRIAATSSRVGDWHVKRGFVPSASLYFFPKLMGMAKATEMLMLGKLVDGQHAETLGLVTEAVPEGEEFTRALALATDLAAGPPVTLQYVKRLLRESYAQDFTSLMQEVADARLVGRAATEPLEGSRAFAEKRDPNWS